MISWAHQLMSVVETTPGQSQKLLKTSESVNLTKKSKVYSTRPQDVTMMGKGFNSGFLASFTSGVAEKNCLMKQQSNRHIPGALMAIQPCCLGALHGEQSLTVLNRCGMLVLKKNIIWNVLKVMISTSK